ncbi:hypothetical protein AVEN_37726-1 [Araneus ventricosus]|uniref:Uncharacterized protein n=1 Tax=Araneus ventricosus TaxID=182803 RepID=A0A4Y2BST1_ARAVE|nr:hypothetical protein AVEN_37726-1 [Araneus ventricosus]
MKEHLNEINAFVNQLKSCGVKISDMYIIAYILIPLPPSHVHPTGTVAAMTSGTGAWGGVLSLPPEYGSSKFVTENQLLENISLQFVVNRLLDAETLLEERRVSETKAPRSESSTAVSFLRNDCGLFQM